MYLNIYHKNEAHVGKYTSPMYPIQALLSHVPREPWLFDTTPRISAAFNKCCNTRLVFSPPWVPLPVVFPRGIFKG